MQRALPEARCVERRISVVKDEALHWVDCRRLGRRDAIEDIVKKNSGRII
jgi:hypothetical protein